MDKKSQEELEKPAKVYQVDALHTEIVAVKKLLEDQNTYLKGTISLAYFEERIKSEREKVEAELNSIKAEYRPVLGNAKWAARAGISAALTLMLTLLGIYLKAR